MTTVSRACGVLGLLLTLSLPSPGIATDTASWVSRDELYRLSFVSELSPIVINRIHRWTLRVVTVDGQPVMGARFRVRGGMPIHDHGLPTQPRVRRELGNGEYLLEGVRFHMTGRWEVEIRIESALGNDTVIVPLEI